MDPAIIVKNYCKSDEFDNIISHQIKAQLQTNYIRNALLSYFEEKSFQDKMEQKIDNTMKYKTKTIKNMIPGEVSLEIQKQMPTYLSNSVQMNKILNDHSHELNNILEQKAKTIINSIINDPHYHEINKKYFDTFKQKGDIEINNCLEWIKQHYLTSMNNLITDLNKLEDIKKQNEELNNKIAELEQSNRVQSYFNCLYGFAVAVGVTCVLIKY